MMTPSSSCLSHSPLHAAFAASLAGSHVVFPVTSRHVTSSDDGLQAVRHGKPISDDANRPRVERGSENCSAPICEAVRTGRVDSSSLSVPNVIERMCVLYLLHVFDFVVGVSRSFGTTRRAAYQRVRATSDDPCGCDLTYMTEHRRGTRSCQSPMCARWFCRHPRW
jgi:hypothetical protein